MPSPDPTAPVRRPARVLATAFALTAALATTAGPAAASTTSGGDDNVAVAVNTKDSSEVYALRLKVVMTSADVVDSANAAVAVSSCTDCQTVAIALEGVLISGNATVIAPVNLALALNEGCSGCETLAYAYQSVRSFDGRVRLTGEGRRGIAMLRQQLNGLRTAGLDLQQLRAEADRIAGDFAALLASEVLPVGTA